MKMLLREGKAGVVTGCVALCEVGDGNGIVAAYFGLAMWEAIS